MSSARVKVVLTVGVASQSLFSLSSLENGSVLCIYTFILFFYVLAEELDKCLCHGKYCAAQEGFFLVQQKG